MNIRRSKFVPVAAWLMVLAAAPGAAMEQSGRAVAGRFPPEAAVDHLSRVVVLVEGPAVRVGDDARATIAAFATRFRDRGGVGAKIVVAGVVAPFAPREEERRNAMARAHVVRDVLISSGDLAPSQVEFTVVDRSAGAGTVEVAVVQAGVSPGPAAASWRETRFAPGLHAPGRGFHERPDGNGCAHARHDLDDFQPGGPFLPCAPVR